MRTHRRLVSILNHNNTVFKHLIGILPGTSGRNTTSFRYTGKVEGRQHSVHEISGIRSNIRLQLGACQIEIMILSQLSSYSYSCISLDISWNFCFVSNHWPAYYGTAICILESE